MSFSFTNTPWRSSSAAQTKPPNFESRNFFSLISEASAITTMALPNVIRQRFLSRSFSSHTGSSRWTTPGHQERPNGYLFNRSPPPPGQSRKWEDWELPCYVTSFLTIVILGVGLNAKPDLSIETWAHQKALEKLAAESASSSD